MKPKISVIVPVYNVEKYLSECIVSIINQTLTDIEIICVNDGSTDSSLKILKSFQKSDDRIRIMNKENGGYGSACNIGLNSATGEYVSIIEPDDFINERMFEDLYIIAKSSDAQVVKSSYFDYRDNSGGTPESIVKINWSELYSMPKGIFNITESPQFFYFHPSIWSCIYNRDFLNSNKIRFVEPKGAGWADNPFQVQTLCLAKRIAYTDEAYYYYRLNNPSSSSNIVNISNPFDRSDEVHNFLKKNKIVNPNVLAHLYKREFSYIGIVLSGVYEDLFDFACSKIIPFVGRMDKNIIYKNQCITDYERWVYELSSTKEGIRYLMQDIQSRGVKIEVVKNEG